MELQGFGGPAGVELLQKLPLFAQLSFDETCRLGALVEQLEVEAGTVVIEQNALGDALFIVERGEVKLSRDADANGTHEAWEELGTLGPGELVGEMSLVDEVLTSFQVTATAPTRLLKLPRSGFQKLLEGEVALAHKIYRSFCQVLCERLRRANLQLSAERAAAAGVR